MTREFPAEKIALINEIIELKAKLSLYTSWQPSDPGTKEAMDFFTPGDNLNYGYTMGLRLARALRAAMVRLAEAEKDGAEALNAAIDLANATHENEISALKETLRIASLDSEKEILLRDEVAALTASLASMTKERDAWIAEAKLGVTNRDYWKERAESAEASLAELRKRMGEAEKVREVAAELIDWRKRLPKYVALACTERCQDGMCRWVALERALASRPSPAPVESKPKCGHIDYALGSCPSCAADTAKPLPEK